MYLRPVLTITFFLGMMIMPTATALSVDVPQERDFVLTAYYSPLPDQCCYVKGSLEADKVLNGNGTHAADGTPVYAGMIAAPSSYAFGTRIALPGLGVFTVHDRGGAINEWESAHRIDVWVGEGEEGLARALAFGVRTMRGTVFPKGIDAPADQFSVERLPAPIEVLRPYLASGKVLIEKYPALGEKGLLVRLLQEQLQQAGYFDHEITGFFGQATRRSLASLIAELDIKEPDDRLTSVTSAYLEAAVTVSARTLPAPVPFVGATSSKRELAQAQRVLRSLGYYRGRTNGVYSASLRSAILAYQQARKLVATEASPGAGRIGPLTQRHLINEWKKKRIVTLAKELMDRERIRTTLADRGLLVDEILAMGSVGDAVTRVQTILADRGYFPRSAINGSFGPLTKESVLRFQLERGIIGNAADTGAGMIGPQTAARLTEEQVTEAYKMVRGGGWSVL